jgi:hypothetical protein
MQLIISPGIIRPTSRGVALNPLWNFLDADPVPQIDLFRILLTYILSVYLSGRQYTYLRPKRLSAHEYCGGNA